MAEKEEIIEKISSWQRQRAKLQTYRDVIALLEKYEGTLKRKHSDAEKKKEKLGRADKSNKAYYAALNESVQLQCQIVEAQQLFLTLTEDALKIAEETEKAEKEFSEFANGFL